VNGAKQQQVWSFDQAIILMNYGEESRVYKETNVHEHSSRSHTLFRVFIESQSSNIDAEHITHRYSCLVYSKIEHKLTSPHRIWLILQDQKDWLIMKERLKLWERQDISIKVSLC